jgi:hypothetical protein
VFPKRLRRAWDSLQPAMPLPVERAAREAAATHGLADHQPQRRKTAAVESCMGWEQKA